ncbi:uncharacterized protein LOC121981524 [Zingiber officinale]|uniref:Uncharacterized protein n=1 Tax=Zingiber officinale TaxID=94328 RepID=A0A8J5M5Y9_ZINOF|nr:uncharacterized protein LOC121981524 [Zingiber officinale]KAG6533788.1 hypothetical protein ZIOFF_007664 [Zingiber officinale]
MDLASFKLDVDELLDKFTDGNYTTLADMKRLWMSKRFSYIFEAKPSSKEGLFMQSLYSYSIRHMVSVGAFSRRLGGLYCLYCLYETQPYHPYFKIYLSLDELKSLKMLVVDAKTMGIGVVPALVKRMLDKDTFLFGSVDNVGGYQIVDEAIKVENKCVQIAYERLMENTEIDHYLQMDLGRELEFDTLKKMSEENAEAKELALSAYDLATGDDAKDIADDKNLIGDKLDDIVKQWDAEKEAFCEQTGISLCNESVVTDDFAEIELLLNE